ncbi:hypothetical protein MPDQ_004577 [Monascus purpureus]|uniref:Uncharacterized protein n=1 Tax=Monascus purpureus TaxID=5098 RepID=A0A507R5W9_MONPU|nr:hypothetical protein MPDQ_004577 [Monascus purpureus]BDD61602.1 hypothetical protein MAP00_006642 [Monascus purpureus]
MVLNAFLRIRLIRAKKDGKPHYQPLYSDVKKEEKEKSRRQQRRLLTPSELPPWYDSNPYILTGYRPVSQSFWTSLKSWTYLHNESCNIYTHLVPGVLFLLAQGTLYRYIVENWNWNWNRTQTLNGNAIGTSTSIQLTGLDWGILSLQLFTASTCLLVSAFYHTLSNHSEHAAHRWLQFDYVGILTLILGNFISGLHFGFYCEPALKYFYWGLILTLSLLTAITLLSPKFRGPQFRSLRLAAFIGTGLSAIAPIGHVWLAWGSNRLEKMETNS